MAAMIRRVAQATDRELGPGGSLCKRSIAVVYEQLVQAEARHDPSPQEHQQIP